MSATPDQSQNRARTEADARIRANAFVAELPSGPTVTPEHHVQTDATARNPVGGEFPGSRGPDDLVIYTPDHSLRTGTNEYGAEAAIRGGLVVQVGGNDSEIPPDGWVLSGHGRGKDWILKNLQPGDELESEGLRIERRRTARSHLWQAAWLASQCPDDAADLWEALERSRLALRQNEPKAGEQAREVQLEAERTYYRHCESKHPEGRGVWVRLEPSAWASVESLIPILSESGFNLVLPETVYYGRTIYPPGPDSPLAQWPQFTGSDPLAALIEAAHARGIEVHAWVHVFFVGFDDTPLLTTHPEWLAVDRQGRQASTQEPGYYYLQPSNPEARQFVLRILEDLVQRYDLDGLQLDYIRYPAAPDDARSGWDYAESTRQRFQSLGHPDPLEFTPETDPEAWAAWTEFRIESITSFVKEVHNLLKSIRPGLQLSAAVFPGQKRTRREKMQDWGAWVEAGWLDFVSPMAYFTDAAPVQADTAEMRALVGDQVPLFTGTGPYLGLSARMVVDQVQAARQGGADGVIFFSHNEMTPAHYGALGAGVFREPPGTVPKPGENSPGP